MRLVASLALILALGAGATVWRAAAVTRTAEAAFPPEGQFVTVNGAQVHAVVAGTGPDVVLIHGASGSARDFTFSLLPRLARDYRVIAFDRPGFGWSDAISGGEALAPQATTLADAARLLGAERPVVVGHSYGGAVALNWAVTRPDDISALVLLASPSHEWEGGLPLYYQLTSPPLAGRVARTLIEAWVPERLVVGGTRAVFAPDAMPAGYPGHFGPRMSLRENTARVNARQRAILKDQIRAMVPAYPVIDIPVEILHGAADATVFADIHSKRLATEVEQAVLHMLPGHGHMIQHTAEDEVVAAISRAVARAARGPDN
ncbi:MAG: hypothetical protein RLZZ528_618 [Pseudomonadota bacterium]